MFSGYNLELSEEFFKNSEQNFNHYKRIGIDHLKGQVDIYKKELEKFIINDEIDGNKLQNEFFPKIEADIFISHSHADRDLANALAGWLNETFGLKVFIDSNVWSCSDDLLEEINSRYSDKREGHDCGYIYNHEKCNRASQHVNMMLSVALQQMIDEVECVILLNTDQSINVFEKQKKQFNATYSPWIYLEMICTQIVRKKPLLLYRNYPASIMESSDLLHFSYSMNLKIFYNISLDHLTYLNENKLIKWEETFCSDSDKYSDYPLDALYSFTHSEELENTKKIYEKCCPEQIKCLKSHIKVGEYRQNQRCNAEFNIYCEKCKFLKSITNRREF